ETLIWRPGMKTWLEASDLEDGHDQDTPNKAFAKPRSALTVCLSLVAVIFVVSGFAQFDQGNIVERLATSLGVGNALVVFGLGMALLSLAAILLVAYVWKHRSGHRASAAAGIVLCIAVCAGFFQITNFAAFLVASDDSYRALKSVEDWGNANIVPTEAG